VFVILMENHNWDQITPSVAPYIWNTLIPMGAHADQYYNPPGNHPSEPNYVWLEAGANLGLTTDADPSASNSSATPDHLVAYLKNNGVSWKTYQEDIDGMQCPLVSSGNYAAKHNPFVFFQDVTDNNNLGSAYCIAHMRPFTELASDLANNTVAQYNFITPNLCNDMHDCSVTTGDTWLSQTVPAILSSQAYADGGMVLITWDEGEGGDGPIGMIVLSPFARVNYSNAIQYTHSSTLRTVQEIFGATPLLRDAANATDLSDLLTMPSYTFYDVPPSSPYYNFIYLIAKNGITAGCGNGNFCPDASVTRAQMAVFLLRGEHGSAYVPPACTPPGTFGDVACPGGFAVDWIEQLVSEGITAGCGGGNYCPNDAVTRAQMAVFLLKASQGSGYTPSACTPPGTFGDVPCPGGFAVDWIEHLSSRGITAGCGGGNYCPDGPNTRAQMAVFLTKTFNLQ